jgi:hypothetical protein
MFEVEYFNLTPTDASNRYVGLSGVPISASNVAVDTIGGTSQALNGDFGVDGTNIKWNDASYALYNQLTTNDNIRVIYDRS